MGTVAPRVRQTRLDKLHINKANPRRISDERLASLKRALEADPEMLQARPLIALPDGRVIAGNMRLRAAMELGWKTIPAITVDLDEARAQQWLLRDNQEYGEWEDASLAMLLEDLQTSDSDLTLTGFPDDEIQRLLDSLQQPAESSDVPPVPETPITKPGDLIELGSHRLLCGDATDGACWQTLFAHSPPPALMVTDPPYGVEVDPTWRDRAGLNRMGPGRHPMLNDDTSDWRTAYAHCQAPIAYVWHSALHAHEARSGLLEAGFELRQQIIWVKDVFALGRAAYQWKHEACWYAVRTGATAHWNGGHDQTTIWEAASPTHIMGRGTEERTPHPSQKPLLLYERPIKNHTTRGDIIVDPFGGSGTALIAADLLDRRAYLIELDPAYCDVIRTRYHNHAS